MEEKLKRGILVRIDRLVGELTAAHELLCEDSVNGAIGSLLGRKDEVSELLSMLTILRAYK